MDRKTRASLNRTRWIKKAAHGVARGAMFSMENLLGLFALSIYVAWVIIFCMGRKAVWLRINTAIPGSITYETLDKLFCISVILGALILLYLLGMPFINFRFERGLIRNGIYDSTGKPPYVRKFHMNLEEGLWEIDFDSIGIPIEHWRDKQKDIENSLNVFISNIRAGNNRQRVILECVPADKGLPKTLKWDETYFSQNDFEIAIGKKEIGMEYLDLNITNHALIAGSTGSGKTMMMKCVLYQCIKKGAQVFLADFKGGANFPRKFRKQVTFITDELQFNSVLDNILEELSRRNKLFAELEYENITEYNLNSGNSMNRVVVAIDEVAECFDKTGIDKVTKEQIQKLEHKVSTIARLGRAAGIHLVLGLQRPSADVLPGQIKAQLDYRICARCDDVLSQIVLDNTDASRRVGKRELGRFVTYEGDLVQGFMFRNKNLLF